VLEPNRAKADLNTPAVDWAAIELRSDEYNNLRMDKALEGFIHEADDFKPLPGCKCAKVNEMV
jgi:hypothetical protein